MGIQGSLMGCHLKYVEASTGIKQDNSGAVELSPLTVTLGVLLFFQLLQLSCVEFQLT